MASEEGPDSVAIDFRARPELYRIGRGEQGVLSVQPYKGEILPRWRFRTPELARASAGAIYRLFLGYRAVGDFVGMDMARKFLQMGYTRARRYANHRSGRKYAPVGRTVLPPDPDPMKVEAGRIVREAWRQASADPEYRRLRERHRELHERPAAHRSAEAGVAVIAPVPATALSQPSKDERGRGKGRMSDGRPAAGEPALDTGRSNGCRASRGRAEGRRGPSHIAPLVFGE